MNHKDIAMALVEKGADVDKRILPTHNLLLNGHNIVLPGADFIF